MTDLNDIQLPPPGTTKQNMQCGKALPRGTLVPFPHLKNEFDVYQQKLNGNKLCTSTTSTTTISSNNKIAQVSKVQYLWKFK